MKKNWFNKYIGKKFYISNSVVRDDLTGDYIFVGRCDDEYVNRKGKISIEHMQYEFMSEDGQHDLVFDYQDFKIIEEENKQ